MAIEKKTVKTIVAIVLGIVLMLVIGFVPPVTELMSRQAWQYLGCFTFMLVALISGAMADWAAVLATMGLLCAFGIGNVASVTAQFSGSTLWLCIGVFVMSVGINNSGFMKRIALWVLCKFPGTYRAQVTAMLLAGLATTPMIPSAFAKTALMAPMTAQVSEVIGVKPFSKQALGIWFANVACTSTLDNAFMSGSAFVALMIGFMGTTFTWGGWLAATWLWYVILIVLIYLFCAVYCAPKGEVSGDVSFLKEQYKALGPMSTKEKQGVAIVCCALIAWITQDLHGVDAGMVALIADAAFVCCGLISSPDANAKGQWTLVLFIGGVLSIANFMTSTGCGDWIASWLGPICAPMLSNPYIFVVSVCLLTFVLRYVIVSQTCCLTVLTGVFSPLIPGSGISMFVFVFTCYMATMFWNEAYMNPSVAGFVRMTGGKFVDMKLARKASIFYMGAVLIALLASVPVWQGLGLC